MYYKKIICMFFAVLFIFTAANGAVAKSVNQTSRENIFNVRSESVDDGPIQHLFSRLWNRILGLLGLDSRGVVEDLSPSEEEFVPEEPEEEVPEEEEPEEEIPPEEPEEEVPEEEEPEEEKPEEEEKLVDLDLEILSIEEKSDSDSIPLTVALINSGIDPVEILPLETKLVIETTNSDGEVSRFDNYFNGENSKIELAPGEIDSAIVDIYDESFKPGIYKVKASYSLDGIEEVSDSSEFEISDPFDPYAFLADAMDGFGFELGKQILSDGETDYGAGLNTGCSFSPTVIFSNLFILLEAAKGDTYNEIAEVLGIEDIDHKTFLNTMKSLYSDYLNYHEGGCELKSSNAIWFFESGRPPYISQSYLDNIKNYLDCEDYHLNFSSWDGFAQIIDSWVEDKTNGLLNNIFDENDNNDIDFPFTESTISLDAQWETPFDPRDTICEKFYLPEGNSPPIPFPSVPFMRCKGYFSYTETDRMQILELPYEGGDVSMLFLLPKDGYDVSSISEDMNIENLAKWRESFSNMNGMDSEVDIHIPKIDISFRSGARARRYAQYSMTEFLINMGIKTAFSEDANFSNMYNLNESGGFNPHHSYLDDINHRVFFKVDEGGIKSAAARDFFTPSKPPEIPEKKEIVKSSNSNEGDSDKSIDSQGSSDSIVFNANHPFIFTIQQKTTDDKEIILFIGEADGVIISPLVLDLHGDGIKTSGLDDGVLFDLNADGKMDLTGWTAGSDDAFLCLDLDRNGYIDNGGELFGDNTVLMDGSKAENGFMALAQYDTYVDGKIDRFDRVWPYLRLWCDSNHNGISEKDELRPIMVSRVKEIYLDYSYLNKLDHGNLLGECSYFKNSNGSIGSVVDVWFRALT